ncbi:MAG: hypothetical protein WD278_13880 [Pirellulales bacterium]
MALELSVATKVSELTESSTATSYSFRVEIDDEAAEWEEVRRLSLTHEELAELIERFPTPAEWLDEDW